MASFEYHCDESIRLFGKPFKEVHHWLDEFAKTPGIGMRHRKFRHHQAGIEEAVNLFGEDARAVAKRHIMTDLANEGWKEGEHPLPKDQLDYIKMGLF